MVVSPTVCSTHCFLKKNFIQIFCSCATNIHLIPASGNDEVYRMPVSRVGMRPGGIVYILLFKHGVGHYQIELSRIVPIDARR